ncbi:MAG: transcriptional regulator GcvA [Ahrensia sp.]|nr:transcriptional regulator GcvA [Ahrensia sp.]
MAFRLPSLNALRAFEAAARNMSFQKAAQELFVTPSALSYQIKQLEDQLQMPLFERLNRSVALTDAGQRLYPGVHEGFERMQGAVRAMGRTAQDKVLVVSSGPAFAAKWLAPRVYRFVDQHPQIELRIAASLKLADFNVDEVDLGLRFGSGDYPGLFVEPLFDEAVLPLASPDYMARFEGRPLDDCLTEATLLHDDSTSFMQQQSNWKRWLDERGIDTVDPNRGPRFSHADHGLDAAVDGAGIVLGRLSLAMRDIRSGRLVAPFEHYLKARAGFYFVAPPAGMELPRVQLFHQWLREEARLEAAEISRLLATKRSL